VANFFLGHPVDTLLLSVSSFLLLSIYGTPGWRSRNPYVPWNSGSNHFPSMLLRLTSF